MIKEFGGKMVEVYSEISTKVKKYEMYDVKVINNLSNINKGLKLIISDNFTYEQFNKDNSYYYFYSEVIKYENIIEFFRPKIIIRFIFGKDVILHWSKLKNMKNLKLYVLVKLCNKYNIKTYF